jgi:glucan 1,3-beta-glucosidase
MEAAFGPIIVGEWSLATDNCAMWLNGFNDNLPGFPRLPCKYVPCSDPYMGLEQPGTPVDPSKALQGPYGTGMSGPIYGFCPVGRDWLKESSGNPQTGHDWVKAPPEAPRHLDDSNNVMTHLAYKKINAFSGVGHGFYFWNFRTDLYEPYWSYMLALERGWIPRGNLNDEQIQNACSREDSGDFNCVLKKEVRLESVQGAVKYILDAQNLTETEEGKAILAKSGKEFSEAANDLIQKFFEDFRAQGATCDFGGIAMLIETNRTVTDDDNLAWVDDEYYPVIIYQGPNWLAMAGIIFFATLLGSSIGFVVAMRTSKKFNRKVRESVFFAPISNSKNSSLRKSLALPEFTNYDELEGLIMDEDKAE